MNQELLVLFTAAAPVSELRGAIPLGFYYGLPAYKTILIAILGNMLPVIPILFFIQPFAEKVRRFSIFRKFFDWLFARTRRKAELIQKYEVLGLILFVALPLPITGAWTGSVAATLFKIRFRYAFLAIFLGVLIAAGIVSILTVTGHSIFMKHT